jgi:hypothetical protein
VNPELKPGNGHATSLPEALPITLRPLYKVLSANLSPRVEAFILTQYLRRSGGKLPSVARAEDLSTKAQAAMRQAIEEAYDLKLASDLVVPNVLGAIGALLDSELEGEFGVHS